MVPIFQAQIAAGGPIKVTHPEARRFFMTISEAVSLVVQASTRSEGSEIFVLDMGEPIRIVDLAENMIRLAGKVPYEEIDIQFTGLRPGEKLIEEIRGKSEGLLPTSMEKMHVIREQPLVWDRIDGWIGELKDLIAARREREIIAHLQELVPEYSPAVREAGRRSRWKWCRPARSTRAAFQRRDLQGCALNPEGWIGFLCSLAPYSKQISPPEIPRAPSFREAFWRASWSCGDAASSRLAARSGTPCPAAS